MMENELRIGGNMEGELLSRGSALPGPLPTKPGMDRNLGGGCPEGHQGMNPT